MRGVACGTLTNNYVNAYELEKVCLPHKALKPTTGAAAANPTWLFSGLKVNDSYQQHVYMGVYDVN